MRFVLELNYVDERVEGEVILEGATQAQPFSSWLELLRLLEPPNPTKEPSPNIPRGPGS